MELLYVFFSHRLSLCFHSLSFFLPPAFGGLLSYYIPAKVALDTLYRPYSDLFFYTPINISCPSLSTLAMSTAAAYGLELQARSLCPLYHSVMNVQEGHHFLVGSASPSLDNKIHLLEYQEDTKVLECSTMWSYNESITGLWCSPSTSEKSLMAVASQKKLEVMQLSEDLVSEPQKVLSLQHQRPLVLWDLDGLQNEFKVIHGSSISTVSLQSSKLGNQVVNFTADGETIRSAALAPYDPTLSVISTDKKGLQLVDFRSKRSTIFDNTQNIHGFGYVTAIDFNRSKPGQFMTAGSDGIIIIHDIRYGPSSTISSIRQMKAHEHTVQHCLFNPFHDELVLSCSSDQTVKLWDLTGQESASLISRLAEFGDSVVGLCWSSCSPWVFAGLSYNGKILVDAVPNNKKMDILLDERK